MSKQRVLFVLDFIKRHYVKEDKNTGEPVDTFFDTAEGKYLKRKASEALSRNGFHDSVEYHVIYGYPQIPMIIKDNLRHPDRVSYKKPTVAEGNKYKEYYLNKIVEYNPDLVVPLGGIGTKPLLGGSSISALRGLPKQVEIIPGQKYWVFPMYGPSYALTNPNVESYVEQDLDKIAQFLVRGGSAFETVHKDYRVIPNDLEEVTEVFKEAFKHGKTPEDPIAWDYETSSLRAEMEGSKILTISLGWHGNPGVTIPINHWEQPWSEEEQKKVNAILKLFLSSDLWKVGHNVQFDERQSKFLVDRDITFKNTMDTMVGYYLSVSQDEKVSFGLKKVAYEFTNMGGYEQPLDDYKDWFLKFIKEVHKVNQGKREALADVDYLPEFTADERAVADKWAKDLLEEYGEPSKVVNGADGEKFSYEWIPYTILSKYASGDVDATLQIHDGLLKKYLNDKPKLYKLYTEHYPQLLDTLSDIEVFGMQLDRGRMEEMMNAFDTEQERLMKLIKQNEYVQQVEDHKEELYEEGLEEKAKKPADRDKDVYKNYTKYRNPEDREFNPSSKDDMQMALFGFPGISLPAEDKYLNSTGKNALKSGKIKDSELTFVHYSTGKEALDWLSENHPEHELVKLLQDYNKLTKLRTTYTQGLLDKADSDDVLHGNLKATATATSRLASSGPNL